MIDSDVNYSVLTTKFNLSTKLSFPHQKCVPTFPSSFRKLKRPKYHRTSGSKIEPPFTTLYNGMTQAVPETIKPILCN